MDGVEQGSPGELSSEPPIINLSEVSFDPQMLEVGATFEGISSYADLDKLAEEIIKSEPWNVPEALKYTPFTAERLPAQTLKDLAEAKKFYGALKDFSVTVLPALNTPPPARYFANREPRDQATEGMGFVTRVDMHSTGRGKIGSLSVHTRPFLQPVDLWPPNNEPYRLVRFGTAPINTRQSQNEVDRLVQEAQQIAKNIKSQNLRMKPISAGLPSLGKRR